MRSSGVALRKLLALPRLQGAVDLGGSCWLWASLGHCAVVNRSRHDEGWLGKERSNKRGELRVGQIVWIVAIGQVDTVNEG